MKIIHFICFQLAYLVSAVTPQGRTGLVLPTGASPSSDTEPGRPYQEYRCEAGPERHHAAFFCLQILERLRQEPAEPQTFNQRYWEDKVFGCHITAEATMRLGTAIVIPDLANQLIFLLTRCFLPLQPNPISRSASIRAGFGLLYLVRIYPPHGHEGSLSDASPPATEKSLGASNLSAADSTVVTRTSSDVAASEPSLGDRAPVRCASTAFQLAGAFTECLPALMQILHNPTSALVRPWLGGNYKEWRVPNCRLSISRLREAVIDSFSEWSLIDDAMWIMGQCFAGPAAARGMNQGWMAVGPRKIWQLELVWGTAMGSITETSKSRAGNDTGHLMHAATAKVSGSDTTVQA